MNTCKCAALMFVKYKNIFANIFVNILTLRTIAIEYEQINKGGTNMDSRTYYYARVSSKEQNLDRQIAAFKALGAQEREIITDKESGKGLESSGLRSPKMPCCGGVILLL